MIVCNEAFELFSYSHSVLFSIKKDYRYPVTKVPEPDVIENFCLMSTQFGILYGINANTGFMINYAEK